MATLQIGGATYRVARKMDAFKQMSVASKIMPLLASGIGELAPLWAELKRGGIGGMASLPLDRLGQIITPVSREIAKMSDEDRRMIVSTCLDIVDRKDDGKEGWARVWSAEANRSMFEEINNDFSLMIRIVALALQETFASFLPASLSGLLGGAAA
jgi:hypothetical protein